MMLAQIAGVRLEDTTTSAGNLLVIRTPEEGTDLDRVEAEELRDALTRWLNR